MHPKFSINKVDPIDFGLGERRLRTEEAQSLTKKMQARAKAQLELDSFRFENWDLVAPVKEAPKIPKTWAQRIKKITIDDI